MTDLSTVPTSKLKRTQRALMDYKMSLLRIGEDSDAADREMLRVATQLGAVRTELSKRAKADNQ